MPSTQIFVNDVSLSIVKSTFTTREDNDSFNTSFTVTRSNNPFLVINDAIARQALNIRSLQSTGKKRRFACKVQRGSIISEGELIVQDIFKDTIKCDVSYYSELYTLLSQKISSFMPTISIDGDTTPPEYLQESNIDIDDSGWVNFSEQNKYNSWPAKDFCLPWITAPDLFGEDLEEGNEWFYYAGAINRWFATQPGIVRNFFSDGDFDGDPNTPLERRYFNRNTVHPCVFILSPLANALESIGYKISGAAINDALIKATHLIPKENQLTKIVRTEDDVVLSYDGLPFLSSENYVDSFGNANAFQDRIIRLEHLIQDIGEFTINIDVDASNTPFNGDVVFVAVSLLPPNSVEQAHLEDFGHDDDGIITGQYTYTATPESIGAYLQIRYIHLSENAQSPQASTIKIGQVFPNDAIYKIHPTIELRRFVPDMTVAQYINLLKNWFNLNINPDDVARLLVLDFNEDFIEQESDNTIIDNLYMPVFSPPELDTFALRYAGDEGEIFIVGNSEDSEDIQEYNLSVKPASHSGITYQVSSDFISGDTPVALYNRSTDIPYGAAFVDGRSLSFSGSNGIHQTYFKRWLRFRLAASTSTVRVTLSEVQLKIILRKGKVYFNDQLFVISSHKATENAHDTTIDFDLHSVNY